MFAKLGTSLLVLLMLALVGAPVVEADTLNGGMATGWDPNRLYSFGGYVPGLYYWNNSSGDGRQANIGWCLAGSTQCGLHNPPGLIAFYSADRTGAAPRDMFFTSTGSQLSATLALTLTDQKGGAGDAVDLFGYYLTDSTGAAITNPTILFTSTDANGTTYSLPTLGAGQKYGFFLENIQGLGSPTAQTAYYYYMDSAANTSSGVMPADAMQHFAIFSYEKSYYIGAVDANVCQGGFTGVNSPCIPASEFDFNDMVIELNVSSGTPEPASLGSVGGALVLAAAWMFWKRRRPTAR